MKKLLIFTDFYFPGYKAGGPIQSVYNFALIFGEDFEVFVVSRDRDSGDIKSYGDIDISSWNLLKNHKVRYLHPQDMNFSRINDIVNEISPDIVYLNSFFSIFSIFVLFSRIINLRKLLIVISPRGELFESAFKIKKIKKIVYLFVFKNLLYRKNFTQFIASNSSEKVAICKKLGSNIKVKNLNNFGRAYQSDFNKRKPGITFRILSLSRIHPIKNLLFFAEVLVSRNWSRPIVWDIYGNIGDLAYASQLKRLLSRNDGVDVVLHGPIPNFTVLELASNYDLLVHPSKSENFGHAIYDAILAGTPLLISNCTPWKKLQDLNIGFDLELDLDLWIKVFAQIIKQEDIEINQIKKNTFEYGSLLLKDRKLISKYMEYFKKLLNYT